jgi:hypothetical protein
VTLRHRTRAPARRLWHFASLVGTLTPAPAPALAPATATAPATPTATTTTTTTTTAPATATATSTYRVHTGFVNPNGFAPGRARNCISFSPRAIAITQSPAASVAVTFASSRRVPVPNAPAPAHV